MWLNEEAVDVLVNYYYPRAKWLQDNVNWGKLDYEGSEANKEIYISVPNESGLLGLQRKIRYRLKNCPLYSYSREYLDSCLREAGCIDFTEIKTEPRGFFVTIRIPE